MPDVGNYHNLRVNVKSDPNPHFHYSRSREKPSMWECWQLPGGCCLRVPFPWRFKIFSFTKQCLYSPMMRNVSLGLTLKQPNNLQPNRNCVLFDGRGGKELQGGFVTLNTTPTPTLPSCHFESTFLQGCNNSLLFLVAPTPCSCIPTFKIHLRSQIQIGCHLI